MQEQRRIALGAVRSQLRHLGIAIEKSIVFEDVLKVLDELHRAEPELIASQWYASASEQQITLLRREWRRQFRTTSTQKRRSSFAQQQDGDDFSSCVFSYREH